MSLTHVTIANSVPRRLPGAGRRRRLQSFFLAIALALVSVPTGVAWAKGTSQTSGDSRQAPAAATTTPVTAEAAPSQAGNYAAREASAKGLENFKGGDTVVIGGSALLIILLIVLIIVLV